MCFRGGEGKVIERKDILKVGRCLDCEDRGLTANPEFDVIPVARLRSELQELMSIEPYPYSVFPDIKSEDWWKLNNFCEEVLHYPLDRVSAYLMRMSRKAVYSDIISRFSLVLESGNKRV